MPLFRNKCWSVPHCPKWCFFCFHLARADGKCLRPYGKDKGEDKISFIFLNTLYHSNNWLQMVPTFLQNHQCQPYLGVGSSLLSLCLSLSPCAMPAATVPVVVSCVARWSQGGFEIPVIRLMFSEFSSWAPARALGTEGWTRKPSDEAVLQESARAHFFMGVKQDWRALRGRCQANLGWVTLRVCCTSSPFRLWFFSVYLEISRSLMNDLEIKLKQNQPKRFYCLKRFIGGNFKALFFRWCCVWQADKWIMLINCYKVSLSFSLFLSLSLSSVHD